MWSKLFFSPTSRYYPDDNLIDQSQIKAPMGIREHKHFWTLDSSDAISKVPMPDKGELASFLSHLIIKDRSAYYRRPETVSIEVVYGGRQEVLCLSSDVQTTYDRVSLFPSPASFLLCCSFYVRAEAPRSMSSVPMVHGPTTGRTKYFVTIKSRPLMGR